MRIAPSLIHCLVLILTLHSGISTWAQAGHREEVKLYVETGIHHSARSVAFSSDGQLLAASGLDRTIKIWDVGSGRELMTLPNNSMASFLAFFPSQPILAAANEDGTIGICGVCPPVFMRPHGLSSAPQSS
jgi:WD40 repeat protein